MDVFDGMPSFVKLSVFLVPLMMLASMYFLRMRSMWERFIYPLGAALLLYKLSTVGERDIAEHEYLEGYTVIIWLAVMTFAIAFIGIKVYELVEEKKGRR